MPFNGKAMSQKMYDLNLSYADLSKITGISKSSLQRYATGTTKKVEPDKLAAISYALRMKPSELLSGQSILDIVAADNGMSAAYDLLQNAKKARPDDGDELDEVSAELVDLLVKLTPQEAEKAAAYIQGLLAAREE